MLPVKFICCRFVVFPPNRHVRQEWLTGKRPAPGVGQQPGEDKSSPRPGARDGMKQEPYELRSAPSEIAVKG